MRNTQQFGPTIGSSKGLRRLLRGARPLTLLLAVAVGLVPMGAAIPCRAQGAASVTPAQRSAALAGAQGLAGRMRHMGDRGLTGMAQILTNRSAGAMGLMVSGVLGMGVALGGDLSGGQAKTPGGLSVAQMKSDYAALQTRWGLSGKEIGPGSAPASLPLAIAKNGRGFLADVAALMSKTGMEHHESEGSGGVPTAREFTYTVLSPTRVRLAMKAGAGDKSMPPAEAVLEDGQWRLDLGDLKTLSAHMPGPPAGPSPSVTPMP